MYRILLVDDHGLFRSGMKRILSDVEDMTVVGEVDSGEAAISFVDKHLPDVVLMDVHMPGMGGIEATRKIVQKHDGVKVVAVTAMSEAPFPAQLLEAGAKAYISKGCPADEMFDAIRSVMKGEPYLSNDVAQKLSLAGISGQQRDNGAAKLSTRELQVMLLITQGKSNQDISDTLYVSPKTISTYRRRIYEKLDVSNDVELTHYAIRHGLLD